MFWVLCLVGVFMAVTTPVFLGILRDIAESKAEVFGQLEEAQEDVEILVQAAIKRTDLEKTFTVSESARDNLCEEVAGTAAFVDPDGGKVTSEKIQNAVRGLKKLRLENQHRIRLDFGSVTEPTDLDVYENDGVQLLLDYEHDIPVYVQFPVDPDTGLTQETLDKVCEALVGMNTMWGAFVAIPVRQFSADILPSLNEIAENTGRIWIGDPNVITTGAITMGTTTTGSNSFIVTTEPTPSSWRPASDADLALVEKVLTDGVAQWGGGVEAIEALKVIWGLRKISS